MDEYRKLSKERDGGIKTVHTLYTGQYAVECIEKIGEEIDFLILDSRHVLPGEILNFLACYPLLKNGCIVTLHDLVLDVWSEEPASKCIASKVLFDTVTADKIIDFGVEGFPNIGAFQITDKYLEDVFSALKINWGYRPKNRELSLHRGFYRKYYSNEKLSLFDRAVYMNINMFERRRNDIK